MASIQYQENQSAINSMFYDSHRALIERICIALDKVDKIEELTTMLLGEKVKIKYKKDPNKPKKPKSGFLFYCDEVRGNIIDKYRKKNGKVVIGDVAKELGKLWKKLSDGEKGAYNEMKNKDQKRYTEAIEKYNTKIYTMQ